MADDKKIHHSSETIQTIAQRYGLTNPDNPNDVNPRIIELIIDNKKSSNMVKKLTDEVFKSVYYLNVKDAEKSKLRNEWGELKYGFANSILRRRTRQTGSIIFDGEKMLLNVDSQSSFRDTPVNEWIDNKGYNVVKVTGKKSFTVNVGVSTVQTFYHNGGFALGLSDGQYVSYSQGNVGAALTGYTDKKI